jgi:hypothetical protein
MAHEGLIGALGLCRRAIGVYFLNTTDTQEHTSTVYGNAALHPHP